MADRFPLIINPNSNQIQELPAGDALDLGSSRLANVTDINATGVITATNFSGSIGYASTAGIATVAQGLTGTPNISCAAGEFSGNVSIAGTLTYEDVTNIDSVGLITARSGLIVTGVATATTFKGAVEGDVTGNLSGDIVGTRTLGTGVTVTAAGVVSATTYYGSGANLTGIDATALKDSGGATKVQANSTGAVVTGVLTATTFSGTFSGNGSSITGLNIPAGWNELDAALFN